MIVGLLGGEHHIYFNEHKDRVEIDVFYFSNKVIAHACIYDENIPGRDVVGTGEHRTKRKKAIQQAIKDLYLQFYI